MKKLAEKVKIDTTSVKTDKDLLKIFEEKIQDMNHPNEILDFKKNLKEMDSSLTQRKKLSNLIIKQIPFIRDKVLQGIIALDPTIFKKTKRSVAKINQTLWEMQWASKSDPGSFAQKKTVLQKMTENVNHLTTLQSDEDVLKLKDDLLSSQVAFDIVSDPSNPDSPHPFFLKYRPEGYNNPSFFKKKLVINPKYFEYCMKELKIKTDQDKIDAEIIVNKLTRYITKDEVYDEDIQWYKNAREVIVQKLADAKV